MCEHDSITISPEGKGIKVMCAICGEKIVGHCDYAVLQGPAVYAAINLWRPAKLSEKGKAWIMEHIPTMEVKKMGKRLRIKLIPLQSDSSLAPIYIYVPPGWHVDLERLEK